MQLNMRCIMAKVRRLPLVNVSTPGLFENGRSGPRIEFLADVMLGVGWFRKFVRQLTTVARIDTDTRLLESVNKHGLTSRAARAGDARFTYSALGSQADSSEQRGEYATRH